MRRAKEKNVVINGVTFELYDDGRLDTGTIYSGAAYDAIFNVYGKPSIYKVNSWHAWCEWVYECMKLGMDATLEISSHNCNMYSIAGEIRDTDGTKYELWITRDHNRAFRTHKPTA